MIFEEVALRKESVDRNKDSSLTANLRYQVALRKESVDRNFDHGIALIPHQVALRKESVDRNAAVSTLLELTSCRSPQGERG